MSKSKRNYREPQEIFDKYGADALRWYFFANQPPWTSIRYSERAIKDSIPEFLLRLWNVYSFFVIYANIDGFDPAAAIDRRRRQVGHRATGTAAKFTARCEARANWTAGFSANCIERSATVIERMDAYDNYARLRARSPRLSTRLRNWYVRRSRDRFWSGDKTRPDKLDAYWTLYEMPAHRGAVDRPVRAVPGRDAVAKPGRRVRRPGSESVHLCDYPDRTRRSSTQTLRRMQLLREIASLGRSARMNAKLKVRQPLAKVEVILADDTHRDWLATRCAAAQRTERQTCRVHPDAEKYITYEVLPNFKRLGPRVGKLMPAVKKRWPRPTAASCSPSSKPVEK